MFVRRQADAAILSQLLLYWYAKDKLALSKKSIWENSIVLKRSAAIVYPSLAKSSDNLMVQQLLLSRNVALVEAPYLYIYCVTGQNTWGADHFQYLFDRAELHLITKKLLSLFKAILPLGYYRALRQSESRRFRAVLLIDLTHWLEIF